MSGRIFVFGSNLAGIHGAGSARAAREKHGAVRGQGYGMQGTSFAIPTKRRPLDDEPMSLDEIAPYVARFVEFARSQPALGFDVVRIGCGLAGYRDTDMAPLFANAPDNVRLPRGWRELAARASTSPTTEPA